MVDNKLPFNLEAEQALLGALILDNSAVLSLPESFSQENFFDPIHSKIFITIKEINNKGQIADGIVLMQNFTSNDAFKDIGGAAYIALLVDSAADPSAAADYAKLIFDLFLRRQLIEFGNNLVHEATHLDAQSGSVDNLIVEHEKLITSLTLSETNTYQNKAGDLALQFVKDLKNGSRSGINFGLEKFDKALGLIEKGNLCLIGGRPSMGKSAVALQPIMHAAMQGKGVFFKSMDMTRNQVISRMISMLVESRLEFRDIIPEKINQERQALINEAAFEISKLPIIIDDRRGDTIDGVFSATRRAKAKLSQINTNLDLVVVDHVQKIRPTRNTGNSYSDNTEIARRLKDGSMLFDCSFIALSQLSRALENRDDKHPLLSDFRDTGAWEEEADMVVGIYRPAWYLRQDMDRETDAEKWQKLKDRFESERYNLDLDCLKVRQGVPQMVNVKIDIGINKIYETSQQTMMVR